MPDEILLVEDCSTNQLLYKTLLTKAGYKVRLADNVEEAIKAIEAANPPFSCVITDMCLPERRGGLVVLRSSQKRDMITPVIILTGVPDQDEIHEALENGAFSYGIKGEAGEHDRLLGSVRRAIDHASLQRFQQAVTTTVGNTDMETLMKQIDSLQADCDAISTRARHVSTKLREIRRLGRKPPRRRPKK